MAEIADYKNVEGAINELINKGVEPSVTRIRGVLGVGSYTTITKHFNSWKEKNSGDNAANLPKLVDLPEDFLEEAERYMARIYSLALNVAEGEFEKERAYAQNKVHEVEEDLAQALEMSKEAEEENTLLNKQYVDIVEKYETLDNQLHQLRKKEETLVSEVESKSKEVFEMEKELHRTEDRLDHTQTTLQEEKNKLKESQKHRAFFEKELKEEQQKNYKLQMKYNQLEESAEKTKKTKKALQEEKTQLLIDQDELNKKIARLEGMLSERDLRFKESQEENKDLRAQLQAVELKLKAIKDEK